MTDLICVGAIAGAYGVRGELRVKSYCAVPEDIENYTPLWTEDRTRQFTLAILRPIKNGFAARIPDVATKKKPTRCAAPRFMPSAINCRPCQMMNSTTPT